KAMGTRKGTGLGLAIVWQLVRDFGGWVHVESESQQGAQFFVYIPYAEQKAPVRVNTHVGLPRGSETILVVDDESTVLDATASMLEHLGYSVLASADGTDAIERLQLHREDVACVVLDRSMPKMNGMECGRHILSIAPGLPIIFTSGHNLK